MDFRILGRLEVLDEGRETVAVAGSKQRALLALLLLHGNETLSTSRLIDELWGEEPPATAAKTVHVHVSRLRKALAAGGDGNSSAGLVLTREHGYELRLDPERLDAARFERLLAEGRSELAAGRPERAASTLERGLALWRGPPLADFAYERFAQPEIARLDELKVVALELLIEAKLALGRHAEVIAELETLTREHPYRERLRALLMLALYRSDRQAEALQAYQNARRQLVAELGIEPGEQLRDLERAILAQDPALSLPAAAPVELPAELATGTPIVGRDGDLEWLRAQWQAAREAPGRLAAIVGARGMGKTRLAAELAAEVRREGAAVLYLDGAGQPLAVPAVLEQVRRAALVVLDDVDRAGEDARAAIEEIVAGATERPLLLLATAEDEVLTARLGAAATRGLTPLGAAGVRAVAQLYAGPRADGDVPVELLLEASGGVPLRAHRVAAEWARAEAEGRLDAAAGRAASGRTDLREAEDELVGNVVELQAVRRRTARDAESEVVACPFKGLAAFDIEDAPVFFGREQLVAEMVARLAGAPLMGVVGPSGSGKSSALRAGLLASLSAGVLPGSERWPLALLRPGEHPVAALERATADAPRARRTIVAVDQFEETFTACRDESERAAFVDALVVAARDPRRRALVLVAVRADFYGRCAAYPELARLLSANHVLVGAMRRPELRRAIELPAQEAGLRVEPELADALIADVEGEPGGLPLLSTALLELWQHRDGRVLRISAYEHAGGVRGAVARLAERAYGRLDPSRRELARRILLRLAGEGDGDAVVRRRVPLAELEADRDERVAEVLAVLAGERLVTVGAGEAEVAHEALLREWPRLRGWLEEDAEGRRLHRHLTDDVADWEAAGREPSVLYRGARLASVLEWTGTHGAELNTSERDFVEYSRAAAERDEQRQRRANRRLRILVGGIAALLAVAVVAGVVAVTQRGEARDAALEADAARLGSDGVARERLDQAMLLARGGIDLHESVSTRSSLLSVVMRSPAVLKLLPTDGWPLFSVAVTQDGSLAAVGSERGNVMIFDARSGRPRGTFESENLVQSLAFSPDGATLAATVDEPPGAQLDIIDVATHKRLRRVELPAPEREADLVIAFPRFAPDGNLVVLQAPIGVEQPSVVRRYDPRTGKLLGRPLALGATVFGLTATEDGRRLVGASEPDDETYVIDPVRLRLVSRHKGGGAAAGVSPDGRTVALGSSEGEVRLLDLRSGRARPLEGTHEGGILRAAFAEDGRTVITTGGDGQVNLWDADGGLRETLSGHDRNDTYGLAVGPDGRTVYSAASDGRALVWDVSGTRRLDTPFSAGEPIAADFDRFPRGLAFDPAGRTFAQTQVDGSVQFVDARTLRAVGSLRALDGIALGVDFSPDGRTVAVSGEDGEVALFDRASQRRIADLRGLTTTSQAVAFSPDGELVAAGEVGDESTDLPANGLQIWSVKRRTLTSFRSGSFSAPSIAFSPDGRLIAAAAMNRDTLVFDVRSGERVARLRTGDYARAVAFSPDGSLLATGDVGGRAHLWSTETWRPSGARLDAHTGRVQSLAFTPDGRTLATAAADGTIQLWDVTSRKAVGSPVTVDQGAYLAAEFNPAATHLFVTGEFQRGIRLDVQVEAWKRRACDVAGRPITRREWEGELPDREYRPVCAGA
jgi:WD40 repeat protein/DNA-binding SARP family transcriptional activator